MFAGGLELACPAPDFNVGAWVDECFCVDCGTQHGKVKSWLCFVFGVGIVYLFVVFVLVVFGGFLDVPCGHSLKGQVTC